MARTDSSSKFVPVNLNNSYGQDVSLSNGASSTSSGLGRSRSFRNSYGGMVSLSRPSRVTSSSSSSATVSRTSKLAVPRPVNLPSLRREHSGNDPTIALVGSVGSSSWTKQTGDEIADTTASRSDTLRGDATSWGNRASAVDGTSQFADKRSLSGGRQSTYSPPGAVDASVHGTSATTAPLAKAVVFRGEDFPTLQAAATPPSSSLPTRPHSRDSQRKPHDRHSGASYQKKDPSGDDPRETMYLPDRQLQPAEPVRMHYRTNFSGQLENDADKGSAHHRGPSPLIKLAHTSNWADDERETLSSARLQGHWVDRNDGFQTTGNWSMDRGSDIDFRRSISRVGYSGRNEADFSTHSTVSKPPYGKDGVLRRDHVGGGRVESDFRGDVERSNSSFGRNNGLRRGWSFPAPDPNVSREARYASPNSGLDRDGSSNGRAYLREGNNARHDTLGHDMFSRDTRAGFQHQAGGQWQESKFGKDVFLGRQGFPGGVVSSGTRMGMGTGTVFPHSGSDVTFSSKGQAGVDYKRDKRVSGFFAQLHKEDPFLGDGISSSPSTFYLSPAKTKNDSLKADNYRDPARESFEAELERVEKMLEQERQRANEERERAVELARKEQEEQERIAREEELLRLKLEEEAREAEFRAQREAEEAARKIEEARKAREDEKRMADLEEERRKEAARRKLLELEERMAKREMGKRQEEIPQKERGLNVRTGTGDVNLDSKESALSTQRKSSFSKSLEIQESQHVPSMSPVSGSSPLSSILRSPSVTYVKEEIGFTTGGRVTQTWRRDTPIRGHEPQSAQKGPPKFLPLRTHRFQQDNEEQHQGALSKSGTSQKSPAHSMGIRASEDGEERDWWVRDSSRSTYSLASDPQNSDLSDYPSYGRLRQSLPRQPRVLPPPPGNTMPRKQASQPVETQSEASVGTKYVEGLAPSREENRLSAGEEMVGAGNQDSMVADAYVSEQFDPVPSEEVVLSDAGSQFSEDSVEDGAIQVEQVEEPHSDVVSETYTDHEVDEISDLTEAQDSSEDFELQRPADWEVSQGDPKQENVGESLKEARAEVEDFSQGQPDVVRGLIACSRVEDEAECEHSAQDVNGNSVVEEAVSSNADEPILDASVSEEVGKHMGVLSDLKDGEDTIKKSEESTKEKRIQDQEIPSFASQAPFLSAGTSDNAQVRHLEGVSSSRQSLFQQPFSFMAVPLPQSGTLNHVGASLPALSSVHTLPNQQDLPFHLQLGLLPGVPLMPNAIQIGSIQMPLHIYPQLTPLTHLHGHQQAPVFQFGQIGPSLAVSQPLANTQIPAAAVQMHHVSGQSSANQHHQLQTENMAFDGKILDSGVTVAHMKKEDDVVGEAAPIISASHDSPPKEYVEIAHGEPISTERTIDLSVGESETDKAVNTTTAKVGAQTSQKLATNNKVESTEVGDGEHLDYNARPVSRAPRGGQRRNNPPRYQGILGRGRGRFHGRSGHYYPYQASHVVAESRPEGPTKRFLRGKVIRRSYRRAEYRVRGALPLFDAETTEASDSLSGPSSNVEDSREGVGYRYVKRGSGVQSTTTKDENVRSVSAVLQSSSQPTANVQPSNQSVPSRSSKAKSLLRKYEVDNAEDAAFRSGVVCVFEQPGIETPNDKDDFIKVRSKRQLLRELREQREKESIAKAQDAGSKDQAAKKQTRPSTKAGVSIGQVGASSSKNAVRRRSIHNDGKSNVPNGTTTSATLTNKNVTSLRAGRGVSASKVVTMESEIMISVTSDHQANEHSTTAAWGGQRSNQEVVSLTQIQLEEAMKPFRLDGPFLESVPSSEKAARTLEAGLSCSPSMSVEKAVPSVKASVPLSSLLNGEKIQFGAVTSPTLIPPDNSSSTPVSASLRSSSLMDFARDPAHLSNCTSSFVTGFLDSHLVATFSLKDDSARKDDGYEGKVVDLEAEAAAEAAASAVVAAAISSEDSIESHSNTRVSEMNVSCTNMPSGSPAGNALSGQVPINCASDNPIAVALPADLSVETSPSLFQGSSMTLANSSGLVLQSLQGGAPTFSSMEMGPLIGGPVFNFGPREDASMACVEPGLSGWQQRHVGTPESFYGGPPFLSPAGLSSIQGHPHMLVYTNPYTPVGQFGQLGVSFMGAAYHQSGKQPDWTHVPSPSALSGTLAMSDVDLNVGSNGLMTSQHLAGASNLMLTKRAQMAGSSVMSVVNAPNLFDTGYAAPFQAPQMDGLVQSHWSKAPAPPVHSVSVSGSTLPMPRPRPAMDRSMQGHPSRVPSHQGGYIPHFIDGNAGFHHGSSLIPSGSSYSPPVNAGSQFPDELGLGESLTAGRDDSGPLSDANQVSSAPSLGAPSLRVQHGHHPSQSAQGHLNDANGNNARELSSSPSHQELGKTGPGRVDSQSKSVGRIGSPGLRTTPLQIQEQRAFKQGLLRDSTGGESLRGIPRRGAAGRFSTSERGGSALPSKMRQIYVAKSAGDSRKVGTTCS